MAEDVVENPRPRKARGKMKRTDDANPDLSASNTQLKVDQMLKQVVAQSTKDAIDVKKKKKKKLKNEEDNIVLESLRKGEGIEGLHKEKDSAILANTFDPDDNVKSEKSNKQRQRRRDKNKTIQANEEDKRNKDEEEPVPVIKEKKKKAKPKDNSKLIKNDPQEDVSLSPKSSDDTEEKTTEPKAKPRKKRAKSPPVENTPEPEVEEEVTKEEVEKVETNVDKKKKKKKKKDTQSEEAEENEEETKQNEEPADEEAEVEAEKTKKKKKKDKSKAQETAEPEPIPDIQDLGEVMALMVHRTDKLKSDFFILHPMVRVHVVNELTGQYLDKQHGDRAVTSYFETSNETVKTVLPMMTKPFDFKQMKSTIPIWEDLLIFNENFNYFTQPNPKVILFFELLDYVSMNTASRQFNSQKEEGGWHRIAWAFLKVLGANGKVNAGQKLRLQLFSPPTKSSNKVPGQPEVYQWWKSSQRTAYPSTLYITLKSVDPPMEPSGALRSMFATQKEMGQMTYKDLKTLNWSNREKKGGDAGRTMTTWTRLFGQLCRVPNTMTSTLTASKKGCYVIKFSHDGRSLACACQDGRDYPILIYEIPSGTLKGRFTGHFGIVYSLSWSKHDTQLVSASSDGTVRIWNSQNFEESQVRLLPHPGFVYTAVFHPRVDGIVVTGGYDEVIRVWDISIAEDHGMIYQYSKLFMMMTPQLQQEIEEHHGHINSLCFDHDDGQKMYSADSVGTILIWNVFVTEQAGRKHFVRDWTKFQAINDAELKDTPINFIQMHPSGRRLLVHARNNAIFMFDLRVQRVMQKYFGAENLKEKICSTITPCGSFVFSGSEDGKVYAWNTDTGDQVAVYTQLNYQNPVTDVHYHPRDHMVAICALGENHPIYIYKYDPEIAHTDAFSPRAMSPALETTDVEDLETARTGRLKETELNTVRSKVMSKDEFEVQEKTRYQRVMKRLDTATMQMAQMPGMVVPEQLLSSRMDTVGRSGVQSTWRLPQDTSYSLTPRNTTKSPGFLSPHSSGGGSQLLANQFSSQKNYMKAGDGDWRPTFSEMGRHGSKSPNSTYFGRPPHVTLNTSMGKPQFTFETPIGKTASQKSVLVMYDYKAQRSDELTLFKGDIVKILYKDNENWWMGEMEDGKQGFFPANYVTEDGESNVKQTRSPSVSSSGTLHAVKTKSGELTFVSGGEQSEDDELKTRVKGGKSKGKKSSKPSSVASKGSKGRRNSIDELLNEYESMA